MKNKKIKERNEKWQGKRMVCRGISSVSKKKERTKVGVEKQWAGKSDGKIQIKKIYAEKLEKMLIEVS